jgi:hypothetical protein
MNRDQLPSGRRLLFGDLIIAFRVANEARRRLVARVFGVPKEGSFLVTVIALGAVAEGLHGAKAQGIKAKATPSIGDTFIGAIAVKETVAGITGSRDSDRRFVGALIATAVLAKSFRPVLEGALRSARAHARRTRATVRRLYGG